MKYRFAIIDDESGHMLGFCKNVICLTSEATVETYEKITFEKFIFNEEFIKNMTATKQSLYNLQIAVLNDEEEVIGSYHCYLPEPFEIQKLNDIKREVNLELLGVLDTKLSPVELRLWDLLRRKHKLVRNKWKEFSEEERLGWLNVVRIHSMYNKSSKQDKQGEIYTIDGEYVSDFLSFFIALGEAINEPGGYYGFNLSSLKDCLCGGFGAIAPFTINWRSPHYFLKKNQEETVPEGMNSVSSSQQYFMELLTILVSGSVTVSFSLN
ncbi:barstar family protein [Paenibacillus terrae]|uniref:Barstar, ribonuclease (Barnase) inhibitor n=1 Tax=Paenibacillus terrae (strain HPL-003) TaxID=985665 RepID=G7VXP9_PAETH|nr:barstar family protein [Paenibacillus terrae]AET59809.1 barstar, ribonuclease (barnase) inhibitor [Paenibacillus terrae HPL-003]